MVKNQAVQRLPSQEGAGRSRLTRQLVVAAGVLNLVGAWCHRRYRVYPAAGRALTEISGQGEGCGTSLAYGGQGALDDLLIADCATVSMKNKFHQISSFGEGAALAAAAATSTF